MRYFYTAVNSKNKKSRGSINAETKAEAILRLQDEGLTELSLTNGEAAGSAPKSIWNTELTGNDIHKAKVSKKKLLAMMNQMGVMRKAGVSLPMAMEVLIDGEKDKKFQRILTEMNRDLYTGAPISETMGKFRAFPSIVVNIVHSGETNGRLDTAFQRCAHILEKEINSAQKSGAQPGIRFFCLS